MRKFIASLLLLLLSSCNEEPKIFLNTEECPAIDTCVQNNDFTVFCYIDSTNCTVCDLHWLTLWVYYEDELKELKTEVALIVRSSDEEAIHSTMEQLRLNFPVVFDTSSVVKRNNPILFYQHAAFAVNRKKEVVWQGMPLENEKVWESFRKTLRQKSFFQSLLFWQ